MAETNDPNVIYLEVDEDITSAIDKLTKSSADSVQVVTAKRSTLFQSVINLKLIKKAAEDAKKGLVVITSDRVVTNLASRVGVPIATRVNGAPIAPVAPTGNAALGDDEIDGGVISEEDSAPKAAAAGAAVGAAAAKAAPEASPEPEPATDLPPAPAPSAKPNGPTGSAGGAAAATAKPPKPAGKSRVPNISTMQKRLLWVGAGVLAILLLFALNYYFTSAKVTLFAKGTQVNTSFNFTADPSVKQSDISASVLAATQISINKTLTAPVTATGSKDNGTKASGTMTVSNSYDSSSHPLVAGTRFVSGDKVFRSTADATVPGGTLSGGQIVPGTTQVAVQADQNGDQYNLGPTSFTIPGLPADQQSKITGKGSQMSGGTSKVVKVVTQGDVDKAKQAALDADKPLAQKDIEGKAGSGQIVLPESMQQNVTSVNVNPDVGAEAQTASASIAVVYTELSVKKSELSDLARSQEQEQVGADKQIYDDGSANLALTPAGKPDASGAQKFNAKATAYAGAKIDKDALAKELTGKKYGEAVDIASRQPEIDKAEITITPGWATSMPGITSHIHIDIKVTSQ
jgi:hypothetical protein